MRILYGTTVSTLVLWCRLLLTLRELGFTQFVTCVLLASQPA